MGSFSHQIKLLSPVFFEPTALPAQQLYQGSYLYIGNKL